jgi:hypothetical protein
VQHEAIRSSASSLEIRERTVTVLQPGWYGPVRNRTGGATAAEYSPSVSHILVHDGTHQESRKPTRNEQVSGSSPLVGSLESA